MKESKLRLLIKELLGKQYELVGLTFEQATEMPFEKFLEYKITMDQSQEWSQWAIKYAAKKMGWTMSMARKEILWLDLHRGLSVQLTSDEYELKDLKPYFDEER